MVPIIELRVAIPMGAALDIPFYINYIISVVGNMLPVPFILLFIRHILHWMKKIPKLDKIAAWIENKAEKNKAKVLKYATFGLYIFVAIPLPGTGAWTGALVASMLDMRMKRSIPAILLGVMTAGVIMSLASYGAIGFLKFLL
ncbi:MAG: small multi-drug export protein [Clostridia bacterium]|nr:small multi-drug export protein [Clostridia bacterium]